ncbi:MAG: FliI/YscN family ATPase [Verrucomicrobia bacterium]|nr:FliI/YscN family ATPase [Verrucomicrobiota bacterium]
MTSAPSILLPDDIGIDLALDAVENAPLSENKGYVTRVIGLVIESVGPAISLGEICRIHSRETGRSSLGEVVGFQDKRVLLMPLEGIEGVHPGSEVVSTGLPLTLPVGDGLKGRVLDALARPIDDKGALLADNTRSMRQPPPHALNRKRISRPFCTGVRAIDSLITCGEGQRMGIFAGSGVGKSTLLGMVARHSRCDVNVIGLIGERGREVREFIERDLGPEGLQRSVMVVATSEQPALLRVKAAMAATTIAEHFRSQGKSVLLLMDSLTRIAMAQREIGLSIGEPPATRGYPPSVFTLLPQITERSGTDENGSITAFYSVLVEADDFNDPISDAARAILDGHIQLARELATANHFPAIDVLESISRLMNDLVSPTHRDLAGQARDLMAVYRRNRDLVQVGAYAAGTNPALDRAIQIQEPFNRFLRQDVASASTLEQAVTQLQTALNSDGK